MNASASAIGKVLRCDARAHYGRHGDGAANRTHFVEFCRLSPGDAGAIAVDGRTVDEKKLCGLRCSAMSISAVIARSVFLPVS
jgi:hypothetical protein